MSTQVERNVGRSTNFCKVVVDIPGIVGGICGKVLGTKAEACFNRWHQPGEELDISNVEGLGVFGQHKLTQDAMFGGHHRGAISPQILLFCGFVLLFWLLVGDLLGAQATVRVPLGLTVGIEAVLHIGLMVILLDKGVDVLVVQRCASPQMWNFRFQVLDGSPKDRLKDQIGNCLEFPP